MGYYVIERKSLAFLSFAVRSGLEPVTPCETGMYSNHLNQRSTKYFTKSGGAYGTRTRDPMRDRHVF